jgi:hypothetical protein
MTSILNYIEEKPDETKRLIGLGYSELQILIEHAEKLHDEKQAARELEKVRIIASGGGRRRRASCRRQNQNCW